MPANGDIALSYDVNGTDASVTLQEWTTTPGDTDPNTGCARSGSFSDSQQVVVNQDIQGAMNAGPIANFLPGYLPQGANGIPGAQFGEASLNLTHILSGAFGKDCFAFGSVWMHSRSSVSDQSSMQDYVAPQPLAARTCSASGAKFLDSNANSARDPGEPGLPRFLIWADYNNDGVHQTSEPFSVTDNDGDYVIDDIHGTYRLREMLLDGRVRRLPFAVDWRCSFPLTTAPGGRFPCAWGPIESAAEPNASGRDFGNWYPGQLILRKHVEPHGDPTQFQVNVTSRDGSVRELVSIGDGQSVSLNLPPGTYDVEEVLGADSGYTSEVTCRDSVAGRGTRKRNSRTSSVLVLAGGEAECAFVNLRPAPTPIPGIGIVKAGPPTAYAGDTLHYTLYVTNTGQVAFPAAGVHVTDSRCDSAPKLATKNGDTSPGTLDPDETWTYTCSHKTPAAGARCRPSRAANTATATGDTGTPPLVTDADRITTAVVCPPPGPKPPEPTPPEPQPIEPVDPGNPDGPVEPDGPTPPHAGDSGEAGIKVLSAAAGCIRTGSLQRVAIMGSRIATVRIYANGRFLRKLTPRILQRRLAIRVTLPPGRYRVTAHVSFQLGSGTPSVIIARTVRICAARALPIRFTG